MFKFMQYKRRKELETKFKEEIFPMLVERAKALLVVTFVVVGMIALGYLIVSWWLQGDFQNRASAVFFTLQEILLAYWFFLDPQGFVHDCWMEEDEEDDDEEFI